MRFTGLKTTLLMLVGLLAGGPTLSATYYLPQNGPPLIGEIQFITALDGDKLSDISRRYGVGFQALLAANPKLDANSSLSGQTITIPSQHLLPDTPYQGLVVNLPEMRIYYYPTPLPGKPAVVSTYPIGIGKEGYKLPPLISQITQKSVKPVWRVPKSIRARQPYLPEVMAAGPDNPLGDYAMRLNTSSYLIHGTNNPHPIGQRISNGCIRMYPEDIALLFPMIPRGTPVRIINQAIKIAPMAHDVYVEAHAPLSESTHDPWSIWEALDTTIDQAELDPGSLDRINRVVLSASGLPVRIHTTDPALWTARKEDQQR